MAYTASRSLRSIVVSASPVRFLMTCWVMVDAPDSTSPDAALSTAARAIAVQLTPSWVRNCWSSVARTAFCTSSGISDRSTFTRLTWRSTASSSPLASSTTDRSGERWSSRMSPSGG